MGASASASNSVKSSAESAGTAGSTRAISSASVSTSLLRHRLRGSPVTDIGNSPTASAVGWPSGALSTSGLCTELATGGSSSGTPKGCGLRSGDGRSTLGALLSPPSSQSMADIGRCASCAPAAAATPSESASVRTLVRIKLHGLANLGLRR